MADGSNRSIMYGAAQTLGASLPQQPVPLPWEPVGYNPIVATDAELMASSNPLVRSFIEAEQSAIDARRAGQNPQTRDFNLMDVQRLFYGDRAQEEIDKMRAAAAALQDRPNPNNPNKTMRAGAVSMGYNVLGDTSRMTFYNQSSEDPRLPRDGSGRRSNATPWTGTQYPQYYNPTVSLHTRESGGFESRKRGDVKKGTLQEVVDAGAWNMSPDIYRMAIDNPIMRQTWVATHEWAHNKTRADASKMPPENPKWYFTRPYEAAAGGAMMNAEAYSLFGSRFDDKTFGDYIESQSKLAPNKRFKGFSGESQSFLGAIMNSYEEEKDKDFYEIMRMHMPTLGANTGRYVPLA